MSLIDWVMLAAVVFSVALGIWRGLIREVVSLAGWVVGAYLALRHADDLGAVIPLEVEWPVVKIIVAGALILIGCVFVAALAGMLLQWLLSAAKLSGADRALGGLFGLARALLIIGLLVYFAHDTEVARQPFWRQSTVLPQVVAAVRFAARHLPKAVTAPG